MEQVDPEPLRQQGQPGLLPDDPGGTGAHRCRVQGGRWSRSTKGVEDTGPGGDVELEFGASRELGDQPDQVMSRSGRLGGERRGIEEHAVTPATSSRCFMAPRATLFHERGM